MICLVLMIVVPRSLTLPDDWEKGDFATQISAFSRRPVRQIDILYDHVYSLVLYFLGEMFVLP